MAPADVLLAGTVMNMSASLNNDTARSVYTYVSQVPYINLALQELEEYYQLHGVSVVEEASAIIEVNAGAVAIVYGGNPVPPGTALRLPDDLIEIQELFESNRGLESWSRMIRRDYLPKNGIPTNAFGVYAWQSQQIRFNPSNQNNDVKIDYIRRLFAPVIDETSSINVVNARTFLEYRTGALCAFFIGEDKARHDTLNGFASLAIDRSTGITVKGKQTIQTRRKPFRSSYKRRG